MNSRPVYQPPMVLTMRGAGRRATCREEGGRERRKEGGREGGREGQKKSQHACI